MPQINLLGQDSHQSSAPWIKGPIYIVRLLIIIFVLLLVYWGYLFATTRAAAKKTVTIQEQIIQTQKEILANKNRQTLLVRQGQLRAADTLIAEHQYWSGFLPELARVTLRTASYISFSADNTGVARLTVTVPSYKDFDQFLQVFDLEEFNEHFSNITVSSVGKYQQGDIQSVRFEVTLRYKAELLKTPPSTITTQTSAAGGPAPTPIPSPTGR
jgi:hypothetical protein